ncbi:hypothetical protein [Sphingopyxis sp. 113P3]|uniref:hypothetical protein n=1 Tax=Sphingopyxis sp. (strain 113P3) TaxID=292913 RepID=UPI0006AD4068|nr:hypothetical protein [Sphingopyxis sp. 113P3]
MTDPFHFNTLSTVVGGGHAEKGLQRAMIVEVGGYAGWQEQEANARLISTSPDLLAAVFQYRDDLIHPLSEDSRERRLAMVNELIAKATGGQQ